jgi:hypothetical protein
MTGESTEDRSLHEAKRRNKIAALVLDSAREQIEDTLAAMLATGDIDVDKVMMPVGSMRAVLRSAIAALGGEEDPDRLYLSEQARQQMRALVAAWKPDGP